ncbi:hypothetical protein EYC84_003789 [Monilinia fructicola]|uniref:Uncharacterized protein n=1 Tax=Monilinia fructicola TaxID=38448 RepID=A0A5M9JVT1_MONFR|nr:hypothetical protein EYC84_003789 [Monilinia fructicola]
MEVHFSIVLASQQFQGPASITRVVSCSKFALPQSERTSKRLSSHRRVTSRFVLHPRSSLTLPIYLTIKKDRPFPVKVHCIRASIRSPIHPSYHPRTQPFLHPLGSPLSLTHLPFPSLPFPSQSSHHPHQNHYPSLCSHNPNCQRNSKGFAFLHSREFFEENKNKKTHGFKDGIGNATRYDITPHCCTTQPQQERRGKNVKLEVPYHMYPSINIPCILKSPNQMKSLT